MAIERNEFLKVLEDSYTAYYSITSEVETDLPLVFRADYKATDERYFLMKGAKIWANEKNEYAYIFSMPSLDPEMVRRCVDYAWADGLPRVKPHKEHQCTNIKVIFVTETLEEGAVKALQKRNDTKNYRFGLYGYSNLLCGVVDLTTKKTFTNRAGHELVPYFRKLFAAREEEA